MDSWILYVIYCVILCDIWIYLAMCPMILWDISWDPIYRYSIDGRGYIAGCLRGLSHQPTYFLVCPIHNPTRMTWKIRGHNHMKVEVALCVDSSMSTKGVQENRLCLVGKLMFAVFSVRCFINPHQSILYPGSTPGYPV